MGLMMANQMGAAGTPMAPPPAPAVWHAVEAGATVGPFTEAQMLEAAATGRLGADTLVWSTGMSGWIPAGQVPPLAARMAAPPPPPPPMGD
jgi:hypothetical protein